MSDPGPVAVIDGVTFWYGDRGNGPPILEDVSLSIEPRDFIGLIGPNGGGKTTLLKLLLGLVTPEIGTVRVLGRSPREVRRRIGYVPQTSQVDVKVPATVLDVVLTGRLGVSSWGFRHRREDLDRARETMREVGVLEFAERGFGQLSGGQRQRVLIARALCSDAAILLLDEPMAGIDLYMEQGVLETLRGLNDRLPIVLVSHDVGFVSSHVKRVACLNRRLAVHAAGEIGPDIIAEMYRAVTPVRAVGHRGDCPIHRADREVKR
ncbi:MAG: ATP-binding cassette domain-containing protein [Planctomycetes bacterium]|jgi:zinc transport system ATP-binding protein|nr:ATP-binding cassette domain-containing protein [Planctomycetota bacterium]